jgi:uncharacterized damage-inducible protein DinB
MNEINRIVITLRSTFEKNAWHGPSLKEALAGITPEVAHKKIPNTHSIIELVGHIVAWRIFTVKKLQGDRDYKVTDDINFPAITDWNEALRSLDESQKNLLSAIESFPEERLKEPVAHIDYKYTYYALLHGIIHHDLYHTGQISLIKKAAI